MTEPASAKPVEAAVDAGVSEAMVKELLRDYGHLDGVELLRPLILERFRGRIALVSSFGAESAILLRLVAEIDPSVPVICVDTGKLFGETLRYRDKLIQLLGLTALQVAKPEEERLARLDPEGTLWHREPDLCCAVRKVEPLQRALSGFDAWISGRKRYQSASRTEIPVIEFADGRVKINPIAPWSRERIEEAFSHYGLPRHPLEEDGFLSIGCMPCTDRVAPGEDARAGRWAGSGKTECGIHTMTKAQLSRALDAGRRNGEG